MKIPPSRAGSDVITPDFRLIRKSVVKSGGGRAYQEMKPIGVGLIMGKVLAFGIVILPATIYCFRTGIVPVTMRILPG